MIKSREISLSDRSPDNGDNSAYVIQNAIEIMAAHPHFRGRQSSIQVEYHHDTLVVTGRLPSFYRKQLLQEALRNIEGVQHIENCVDVVCCDGVRVVREK